MRLTSAGIDPASKIFSHFANDSDPVDIEHNYC